MPIELDVSDNGVGRQCQWSRALVLMEWGAEWGVSANGAGDGVGASANGAGTSVDGAGH